MMLGIRDCVPSDMQMLLTMIGEHAAHEQAEFSPNGKLLPLSAAIFSDQVLKCWIVEVNGTIAGYCTFTRDFSTWDASTYIHMDCLYLRAAFRGKGVGKKVLTRLKEYAKAHKVDNIQWQTPSFNEKAIAFYHQMGAAGKEKIRYTLDVRGSKLG
jgi:GNAT superfamily N-acetyltransferase